MKHESYKMGISKFRTFTTIAKILFKNFLNRAGVTKVIL